MRRAQQSRNLQLGPQLVRGSARIAEELPEFPNRSPAARLGYVGSDGEGGSDQLIPTRKSAGAAESPGERCRLRCDAGGDLVYQQMTRICMEYHVTS